MQKRTIQILSVLLFLGLVLWGGYTFIMYLGVPVHGSVLVDNGTKEILRQQDCSTTLFSCGLQSFIPFLLFTFERATPFLGYVVICAFLFAGFVGWSFFRTGRWQSRQLAVRPMHFILGFLFLLWLIFTVLANGETDSISMRQIPEPSPLVYTDATPPVLKELENNFDALRQRGCLNQIGQYTNGAKVYHMSEWCMQESFLTRVFPLALFVLAFLFELLVIGRMILRLLKFTFPTPLLEATMSAGVGACTWVVILWTLAVAHIIIMPVAWTLVLFLPCLAFRDSLYWLRRLVHGGEEREVRWFHVHTLLLWLLLSYLAFNFLTVVRPFPIGWDDLGSYLNRPRLMVSYGSFIFSMAPFQWEYLTSLGFLLFGYNSIFGATVSMMVNWTAGLLALSVVYAFARHFLGSGRGLLSALLYYSLPLVGHFSFADMKVDNAVFTTGALAMFALFLALFPPLAEGETHEQTLHEKLRWIALAGVFAGFAFAMKPTTVMVLMALSTVLIGISLHWTAFVGGVFFAVAVFVKRGVLDITGIVQRVAGSSAVSPLAVLIGAIVLGMLFVGIAFLLRSSRLKHVVLAFLVFGGAFLCTLAPWVYHNNFLMGNIIPRGLEFGAPNPYSLTFDVDGTGGSGVRWSLPPDLRVDPKNPACHATGGTEELDRYWGYRKGWEHFLTLPWRTVLNLDSAGYYVTTTPALFLFPLLLLLPFFWRRKGRWLKWLTAATGFILLEWMFLANGIPWYGIGVFLGLVVGIEALVAQSPDLLSRSAAAVLVVLALLTSFNNRFWQYDMQRNLLEYPFGKISAAALQERTVSHYDDIATSVLERNHALPKQPYLYRIGTFIPYFIPRNLEIIGISDHQLDFFNCLFAERNPELTLKRLKALGFNSIVFDTNTATIERDLNGSLHQKVNAFIQFVNTRSIGLMPVVNDSSGGIAFILLP